MFFTQELLARRDSGFGLLWLAATLGAKSNFKKLPKRSVLTADIAKLCDLISEPAEPLALRLSSNLMFGVVRVYKVKQEILFTDVSNCVTALKKVVHEMSTKAAGAQLQMAQTSLRPSAVTIVPDSRSAHIMDYDAFVTNWDEYLNILDDKHASKQLNEEDADDDFNPTHAAKKKQRATRPMPSHVLEVPRNDHHTLTEHHEHLLSATFDLSFAGDGSNNLSGPRVSSSQADVTFGFDENPFNLSDGLDMGEDGFMLGDELARELGWGSPAKGVAKARVNDDEPLGMDLSDGNELGYNFEFNMAGDYNMDMNQTAAPATPTPSRHVQNTPRSKMRGSNKENIYPRNTPGSVLSKRAPSPVNSFRRLFLSQDQDLRATPLQDATEGRENGRGPNEEGVKPTKKRARLLLDARTELTDDELKVARAQYLEFQTDLKREMLKKKSEKDGAKLVEDLMWSVPKEIQDPSLIDFWQMSFKVQVEARSGLLVIHREEPRTKRRKRLSAIAEDEDNLEPEAFEPELPDMGMMMEMDDGPQGRFLEDENLFTRNNAPRGSSEEPGQARLASRRSSAFDGSLGLEFQKGSNNGSQKSSLFPWDNAGPSSSNTNVPLLGDDNIPIDHVEIRLRGSSRSQRSSVAPSQFAGPGYSPIAVAQIDYEFNVAEPALEETQEKSEVPLATLERNSFNFLEYAKMQYRSLQAGGRLTFEMVVPQATSTRHVAASAFYHCLVLATKDLVRLEQRGPYETVVLGILN